MSMFELNSYKKDVIDHDKLSRQIRTYGIKITKILSKLKILIVGLRGYGVEIAKNIILSNPYHVSIFDDEICKINDLGCNYFLTNDNVFKKERRDEACLKKLAELNPTTKVAIEIDYLSKIKDYDVVIITEIMKSDMVKKINKECHENNKGFIYTFSLGLTGFIFSDFGENHVILEKTGKERGKFYISNITKEKNGKIKIDYNSTEKRLNDSGYLLFKEVEGMTELNNPEPRHYEANPDNREEFFIGDTSNYNEYIGGGIVEEYFYPTKMKYQTLEKNLMNPTDKMMKIDYSKNKTGRKQLLHILFITFQNYYDKNGKLPELNNEEESKELYNSALELSKNIDRNNEFFKELPAIDKNEHFIKDICKFSRAQHPSLCSFLGGFVAQEAIKFTGLYCPLNQWFWIDIYDETIVNLENPNRTLLNSRYDDLIAIYGQELVEKLHETNMFMIGAGAVGCEYLKILSLMGVATKNNCKVTVTDNDCIENSNLNRQFLFRKEHIGKSKSLIACEEVKKINPEFNCESLQVEVREETEDIFDEDFYKSQQFVLIAVDNVQARNYISNQCTLHRINLIECGTLGENASSQLIIPFISEEYKGTERKQKIGMCTIRNLPSLIEHCIEWSRDKFFEYFGNNIRLLKNFIEDPKEFFVANQGNDIYEKLLYLKNYLKIYKSKSYDKCLILGKKLFYLNYKKIINDTLKINPPDKVLENGTKFWKGSNRLPHILEYNPDDETNFYYIDYFSYLLSDSLGIPYNNDINYKKKFLKINEISENDELFMEGRDLNKLEENLEKIEKLKSELIHLHSEGFDKENIEMIHEQIFEKDHDENHQIDFIYISSNLRASNFNIEYCNRDKAKFISGNIVPSIPTTTASIVGFISSQIYILLQTNDINKLRQINIDLSTPFFLIYKPKKPYQNEDQINPETKVLTKAIPPSFTCWDYIEVEGNKTVDELLEYINEKYKIEINGLYTLNSQSIIKDESTLQLNFQEAYYHAIGKNKEDKSHLNKSIYFKILADVMNDEDTHVKMPKFKYLIN
jgi:ubiquitin-activating enzyme E1